MSGQVASSPPRPQHQLVLDLFPCVSRLLRATRHTPACLGPGAGCWMLLDIALVRTFIVIMPQPDALGRKE